VDRPYLTPDSNDSSAGQRSLILAGGGMRVAYQAGVMVALDEAGLKFHHVDGTSGGTINLSMVLSGLPVAEICERWRTLDARRFAAPLPLSQYLRSPHWPGLGGASGLRDHVFPHLGIDPAAIRAAKGVRGTYNVANFATKSAEVIVHTAVDLDLLVAGVSLPVLMPGVPRHTGTYTDAVWIRDSNLPEAVRQGSREAWLVWCIGNTPRYHPGLFRQYVHMIEMAATGSLLGDLERLAGDPQGRQLELHVIKPSKPLPLDPAYFLGRIDASALIDLGYQDARRYLDDPKPLTAPWSPDVTGMEEPPPSVSARLVLGGPFGAGHAQPDAGAAAGRAEGTAFRARVRLEAPVEAGRDGIVMGVAGHVDVPSWPPRTLIAGGRARIGGDPPFQLDARCRTSAGEFLLRADSCPQGLAVRVSHADAGGVIGSGIVPFGWAELAPFTRSITAADTISSATSWRARVEMARTVWRAAKGTSRDG
jgi:predicted acylesterase/phospholipase RssA